MKKLLFLTTLPILFAFIEIIPLHAQLLGDCNGNYGFGMTPSSSYKVDISGSLRMYGSGQPSNLELLTVGGYYGPIIRPTSTYAGNLGDATHKFYNIYCVNINGSLYTGSDSRFKENVKDISNALDIVLQLKGVQYDLKKEFFYNITLVKNGDEISKLDKERKNQLGLIAQDVEKVIPSAVRIDDSTGYYSMDYTRIIPLLVEAIKEQNNLIVDLQNKINNNEKLKNAATDLSIGNESSLAQNIPNPFNTSTKITYYLSDNALSSSIYLYDMTGKELKKYQLTGTGTGELIIEVGLFKPGMYFYTLIVNNQIVGTKQMILTD